MQLSIQRKLPAAVLLSLAAVLSTAHAQADSSTLEGSSDGAVVFANDGTWPAWQDQSTRAATSITVEAARDSGAGGAVLNPFSQPAELLSAPLPASAPYAATVAQPPAPPESDSATGLMLMAIAAGAVLAGFALRRLQATRRRSA